MNEGAVLLSLFTSITPLPSAVRKVVKVQLKNKLMQPSRNNLDGKVTINTKGIQEWTVP